MAKTVVLGLPELRRKCRALSAAASAAGLAAAREAAEEVRASIRSTVAQLGLVDTGFMRDHVEARPAPDGSGFLVGFFSEPFAGDFYPAFVHYGTATVPPTFFMTTAFDACAPAAVRHMEFLIGAGIASAAGKG